jgi:hypothetical protein
MADEKLAASAGPKISKGLFISAPSAAGDF